MLQNKTEDKGTSFLFQFVFLGLNRSIPKPEKTFSGPQSRRKCYIYLATSVSFSGLLVVHDSVWRSDDQVTELTRGQEVRGPLLHVVQLDVEAWADNTTLVESANQLNNNLAASLVINNLELTNVTANNKLNFFLCGASAAEWWMLLTVSSWLGGIWWWPWS